MSPVVQALAAVARHFPDVWLEFAMWHSRTVAGGGGKDAALTVLDRATKVLPCKPAQTFPFLSSSWSCSLVSSARPCSGQHLGAHPAPLTIAAGVLCQDGGKPVATHQ